MITASISTSSNDLVERQAARAGMIGQTFAQGRNAVRLGHPWRNAGLLWPHLTMDR